MLENKKGRTIFFTLLDNIGVAIPRRLDISIKKSGKNSYTSSRSVDISGAVVSQEWFESISNSLNFVSKLLDIKLTEYEFSIRIQTYEDIPKKSKENIELVGRSTCFPFTMLLLSLFLDFKLPCNAFFSGCLWDNEGWLARTDLRIVKAKAECISRLFASSGKAEFYAPKWILSDLENPLVRKGPCIEIYGVQNILQCLKLLNPEIHSSLHEKYVDKFLSVHNLSIPAETSVELEKSQAETTMLLLSHGQDKNERALPTQTIRDSYQTQELQISKTFDFRQKTNSSQTLAYLVKGNQILWKELVT